MPKTVTVEIWVEITLHITAMVEDRRPTDIPTEMPIQPFVTTATDPGQTDIPTEYLRVLLTTIHRQGIMQQTTTKRQRNLLPGQEFVPIAGHLSIQQIRPGTTPLPP